MFLGRLTRRIVAVTAVLLLVITAGGCSKESPREYFLNQVYGFDSERQVLDLCVPRDVSDPPLLIFMHGGGWLVGDKGKMPVGVLRNAFIKRGYAFASINYRFSNEAVYPAQVEDAVLALEYLKNNAAQYGYNPNKVVVWGVSAGGYMAKMIALGGAAEVLGRDVPAVSACIDWASPSDFTTIMEDMNLTYGEGQAKSEIVGSIEDMLDVPLGKEPEKQRQASPITYVSENSPPILVQHGTMDTYIPFNQSKRLALALYEKIGTNVQFRPLKGSGHSVTEFMSKDNLKLVSKFLKEVFKLQG